MYFNVHNPRRAAQIIFDGLANARPIRIEPNETKPMVELSEAQAERLRKEGDLEVTESTPLAAPPPYARPSLSSSKRPVIVVGMWGIGDNLHQRAVLRELMKIYDVWLETCHAELYHDLVQQGLKLIFKATHLRAQAKTIQRERQLFNYPPPPADAPKVKLWYKKPEIDKYGTICQAMFPPFGLRSDKPDFSLPVRPEWTAAAERLIEAWKPAKPLMAFRPIVLRKEWDGNLRNPDPRAYRAIFESIRDRYFVVSVADLQPGLEWIVGGETDADVRLHNGELDFPTMAGLWRKADLFFGNAGFGPVLAQAVGAPTVVVYGGRESYRTTDIAGAHLAPTLGLDPINPCDCHSHTHNCDKRIDVPAAIGKLQAFLDELPARKEAMRNAEPQPARTLPIVATLAVKLNFGCGTNKLDGWRNMDIEVDISQPLPFESNSADAIFSEHCVEHVDYYAAIRFFEEAFRVLKPGGLIRITVPSIEQVMDNSDEEYWKFSTKWQDKGPTRRGAMHAILFAHGHKTAWTASLLRATLCYAGFGDLTHQSPGRSDFAALRGLEGHGRVIGDRFNEIESLCFEGVKPDVGKAEPQTSAQPSENSAAVQREPVQAGYRDSAVGLDSSVRQASTLVFATTYVDSPERQTLTRQWMQLHTELNPDCDFLIVDSASPLPLLADASERFGYPGRLTVFNFGDNVGHLSRGGRDGWGRAFCHGLDHAAARGYQHVVHIEGDSLCRVPVARLIAEMTAAGKGAATIPVLGTTRPVTGWAETGLMAFSCAYLEKSRFTKKYDWSRRTVSPTPERVVAALLGSDLFTLVGIKGSRNDNDKITHQNVVSLELDWITHCHRDIWAYREFVAAALARLPSSTIVQSQTILSPLPRSDYTICPTEGRNREPAENIQPTFVDKAAIVIGGAGNVLSELADTEALLAGTGVEAAYLVINDMIPRFERPCIAVSLHPQKLATWLEERASNHDKREPGRGGFEPPSAVWAHVKHKSYPSVTHATEDWRGSSGLFAIAVARKLGYERIILCGVPMSAMAGHIVRGPALWRSAEQFLGGWRIRRASIAPHVRSWSGLTCDMFGKPDLAFLSLPASQ